MACYCGVCGEAISSAYENGGSFPVLATFSNGWDRRNGFPVIDDTCEGCALQLSEAIAKKAQEIAEAHRDLVEVRRRERIEWEDRQQRVKALEVEHEREFREKLRKEGLG